MDSNRLVDQQTESTRIQTALTANGGDEINTNRFCRRDCVILIFVFTLFAAGLITLIVLLTRK